MLEWRLRRINWNLRDFLCAWIVNITKYYRNILRSQHIWNVMNNQLLLQTLMNCCVVTLEKCPTIGYIIIKETIILEVEALEGIQICFHRTEIMWYMVNMFTGSRRGQNVEVIKTSLASNKEEVGCIPMSLLEYDFCKVLYIYIHSVCA